MNLQLVDELDPILRLVAPRYDFNSNEFDLITLVNSMTDVMLDNNGIGLAAPQVGISTRILIMGRKDDIVVCINPELISGVGEICDIEGCLSFPQLYLKIKRWETIQVSYQIPSGEIIRNQFDGLYSRAFQHELDHLNGICFVSHVGPVGLELAQRRRRKLIKSLN